MKRKCGLGFYTLKINGKNVGDELLTRPITTYDIAEHLKFGENEITVTKHWRKYFQ